MHINAGTQGKTFPMTGKAERNFCPLKFFLVFLALSVSLLIVTLSQRARTNFAPQSFTGTFSFSLCFCFLLLLSVVRDAGTRYLVIGTDGAVHRPPFLAHSCPSASNTLQSQYTSYLFIRGHGKLHLYYPTNRPQNSIKQTPGGMTFIFKNFLS